MRHPFFTADVFTDRIFGGNPLAVFPDAAGLTSEQMQRIAAEINYSETTFVLPPQTRQGTRQLRIFTPKTELPFAGHPTVGSAFVLAAIGEIAIASSETQIIFEEGVGPVPVTIYADESHQPTATELIAAQAPMFDDTVLSSRELAEMLSLPAEAVLDGELSLFPQAVSCGVPFLFVPLRDRASLSQCRLDRDRWQRLLADSPAPSVYPFCLGTDGDGVDIHARMFAPALGIEEDPATGSAATALGGYLGIRQNELDGSFRWTVEQGTDMGRPSRLMVAIERRFGAIAEIRVGGASVLVSEGFMTVPSA